MRVRSVHDTTVSFNLRTAGVWSYDIQWGGVSIDGWPQQVTSVPGPVSAAASIAEGFAVAAAFEDGQEVLDDEAQPVFANALIEVCHRTC